jgi:predicted alpha/beta-fold hydrolase
MTLIPSSYRVPIIGRSAHAQTIAAYGLRPRRAPPYRRERLELSDGDFLDIDWLEPPVGGPAKLAVVGHGLEGSSSSSYVISLAARLLSRGWSVAAWNMRGCSGEPNRLPAWYHSGKSEDLRAVFESCVSRRRWERVYLVGFSIGGNIALKFLGERGAGFASQPLSAVSISAPCELAGAARRLAQFGNRVYLKHFISLLKRKARDKAPLFPEIVTLDGIDRVRDFHDFDSRYTAPLSGFSSADDYWAKASSLSVLDRIAVPALMIAAEDDPFLTAACAPREIAARHAHLHLEQPQFGGHVGFIERLFPFQSWLEGRIVQFGEDGALLSPL